MTDTHTTYDIYVLGDEDTSQRMDMLSEKAAEHGAVITQTFAFPIGETGNTDDLTEVEAVVEAMGLAIATHTPLWLPVWQDLCGEQNLRRVCLTLQRHGIDLLLGPHLAPCPTEGGISEIDAALRNEVRAVYALDDAAMAVAGMQALGAEIEAALTEHAAREQVEEPERVYSTADAAELFGKSRGWVARGVREGRFEYADGSAVEPILVGGRRQFTVDMLRAIAWSAYRRGVLDPRRLEEVLAELFRAQR